MKRTENSSFFDKALLIEALKSSFVKLDPRNQLKNPVMFVVFVGAIFSTFMLFTTFSGFNLQIVIWLWFTSLFANFAEAIAEGRGKAQADSLRKLKTSVMARKMNGTEETPVIASELRKGDVVVCEANDIIPMDGEIIEGIATVDESAITGESAPVIRESGGDRSAVTGGTMVLSDRVLIQVTCDPGDSFIDRMIALVEGAKRQKTPNEIALTILLSGLTIIFVLATVTLYPYFMYSVSQSATKVNLTLPILISLLVCLIPTTIGGLLSAIGISGMDRLLARNVIAKSGRAVEAAGDIDVLLLDKTGTITFGNRMATEIIAAKGVTEHDLAEITQLSSLSDDTPEGRSIVTLIKEKYNLRGRDLSGFQFESIPFTAQTRMSGVDIIGKDGVMLKSIRKGAADSIKSFVEAAGNVYPEEIQQAVYQISNEGSTPLVVIENAKVIGVIRLKDVVKGGIKERFAQLRKMGIKTVMVTGDNPLTAASIAAEAGVDDFIAEAKPEDKLELIRVEQADGKLVAMIGDGTNDAPALAQANVGVAMNTGTQAAREAGNMVDLDSNPTKLIEIVEIGKQLLMTRGALTTFSIANDVAKYFAIIPAIFAGLYGFGGVNGPLSKLNVMHLHSPESAVLSSIIFNALIIVALIPLALKGITYRPSGATQILRRNILIYGVGGLIVPFVGIKIIDMIINILHFV